jgi:hypothetical protein
MVSPALTTTTRATPTKSTANRFAAATPQHNRGMRKVRVLYKLRPVVGIAPKWLAEWTWAQMIPRKQRRTK